MYVAMQLPVATFSEFSNIHRQQHYYGCVGIQFAMRGGNSIKLSRSGYPTETGFLDPGYLKLVGYSSWGYVRKHVTLCKSSDPPRLDPEDYHLEQHPGYMYERAFVL